MDDPLAMGVGLRVARDCGLMSGGLLFLHVNFFVLWFIQDLGVFIGL